MLDFREESEPQIQKKKSTHTNEDKQQRITDNKNSMPSYISTLKTFGNVEIEGKDQTEKLKDNQTNKHVIKWKTK